jgi:hypothetical protein
MSPNNEAFIKHVKKTCKENGVKCSLRNVKYVKATPQIKASGYFDAEGDEQPILVCSMKSPLAFEILVHEYAHVTQWIEQCDAWKKGLYSLNYVEEWLSGESVRNIKKHLANARNLELDNEKRSVKLIKTFDLDIDIDLYIKRANLYLHFYNYLLISRRWAKPGKFPYTVPEFLEASSKRFNMNYDKLPKKLEKLFKEHDI